MKGGRWLWIFCAAAALGQSLDVSSLDKLSDKAKESTVITLNRDNMGLATKFMTEGTAKDVAKLLADVKSIVVRSFEFGKKGQYQASDLAAIRKQLHAPGWTAVMQVKEEEGDVAIYTFIESKQVTGIAILAAEAEELTVVNIVGPISLADLGKLGGNFGIPKVSSQIWYLPFTGKKNE